MITRLTVLLTLAASAASAEPTVTAPASAGIGYQVTVTVNGTSNPRDFVTIVPKDGPEGSYGGYAYVAAPGSFKLAAAARHACCEGEPRFGGAHFLSTP